VSDTIFALSSGRPPAGIAVIRISGQLSFYINGLFANNDDPPLRVAQLRTLRKPGSGDILDQVLVLGFRGPHSATGEDVIEWHCHGGQAVVRAILDALHGQTADMDLREAQPGEFTRRAFENGRIDLNEAEGLADLLSAETETQRRSALLMAEGHFSRRLDGWRTDLLRCAALTESLLDFSDEDDVPDEGAVGELKSSLCRLGDDMQAQLAAPSAERLNDGIRVVLAGPPNAGKSTLLNALAGRDAAIVSDIAGTTRDRIDVPVSLNGIAFTLTDTAGLNEKSEDRIEQIGIDRARVAIDQADILLWLGAPSDCPREDAVRVSAQMDRVDWQADGGTDLAVSAVTGENMDKLVDLLCEQASHLIPAEGSYALHARQRESVSRMKAEIAQALTQDDLLIVAEHLRMALGEMDRLVGRAGVEDMLDTLFGRFCIGK
jgi:tRNA modification GTPase